jgi:tRNA-specific 2-thiouridylase
MMCNKEVKFGAFLDFALENGADLIATGHYARIVDYDGKKRLAMGVDTEKDQSYFLSSLGARELLHTVFPIGGMTKREVRERAREAGLPNADKKDSQGLCFMGPIDMETFLTHYIDAKEGDVLDEEGNVIGKHNGAMLYAIGQRHGFATKKTAPNNAPYFVVAKDIAKNTVIVAHRTSQAGIGTARFTFEKLSCDTSGLRTPDLVVRLRHRGELFKVSIEGKERQGEAVLERPVDISSGQFAVFYVGDICLGGGVIDRTS